MGAGVAERMKPLIAKMLQHKDYSRKAPGGLAKT